MVQSHLRFNRGLRSLNDGLYCNNWAHTPEIGQTIVITMQEMIHAIGHAIAIVE